MRRILLTVVLVVLAAPAAAQARVIAAESVLPPGQSGHVSITGVASGTGSPHLTDQNQLFIDFAFKPAQLGLPGESTSPRPGVTIVRDSYGVPAVTGASDYDAWWGVGYAVAQDRLFQLEAFRRATSGRLAEMLGSDSLEDDIVARRDYYTDAEIDAQLAKLPATLLRRAEAYRDGINAHIAEVRANPLEMPGEFPALAIAPADWTLRDTGRVGVFLARTVPSGDGEELNNTRALRRLGARAFQALLPLRTPGRVSTIPRKNGLFPSQPGRTRRQERKAFARSRAFVANLKLPASDGGGQEAATGGSYMWAIRAATPRGRKRRRGPGPAYLFNGPQLGYSIPELFVEFELHSPVQNVRGVSAAGVPVVGIGHNGRVAWGFTSGLSDEDDLYAERLTGEESYEFQGRQRQMDCRDEVFDYRAAPTSLPDYVTRRQAGRRLGDGARLPHRARPGAGASRRRGLRPSLRDLGTRDRDADRPLRAQRRPVDPRRRSCDGPGHLERERDRRRRPGQHRLLASGAASASPPRVRRAAALPGHGRGGVARLPGARPPAAGGQPPAGLPLPVEQRSLAGLDEWRRAGARTARGAVPPRALAAAAGQARGQEPQLRGLARHRPQLGHDRAAVPVRQEPAAQRAQAGDRPGARDARRPARLGRQLPPHRGRPGARGRRDLGGAEGPGGGVALGPFGGELATDLLSGEPGSSHEFDASNAEAYALRTLTPMQLASAAAATAEALGRRFGSSSPSAWREPRRMYDVGAQGAGSAPELPFFDRGTWQQSVALGP